MTTPPSYAVPSGCAREAQMDVGDLYRGVAAGEAVENIRAAIPTEFILPQLEPKTAHFRLREHETDSNTSVSIT